MTTINPIIWKNQTLTLLDQRRLPNTVAHVDCKTSADVADAIKYMVVRGAPAIGIAAAYGMAIAAHSGEDLAEASKQLSESRPTAVNLFWALERIQHCIEKCSIIEKDNLANVLETLAIEIHQEDKLLCDAIAQHGADFIGKNVTVYTHCNTGALATGGVGTALGVITELHKRGHINEVFAGETRPWLQGSRLTAFELKENSVPFQLVCDSAAAHTMKNKGIDWLIVGADRIAKNGDTANKIGTFQLALIAKQLGVKVMVAAPTTTIDIDIASGDLIEIEERPNSEVTHVNEQPISTADCPAFNPAFDVTPYALIDVIITENGVFKPA